MRLRKLNPQKNLGVRSILYAIGCGGAIHFLVLFFVAVKDHNAIWFNPLFAVDIDRVWPGLENNYLTFIVGWMGLAITSWVIYKLIRSS